MIDFPVKIPDPQIRNKFRELITASNSAEQQLSGLAGGKGAHTITLTKLTTNGTNGSITWNASGVVVDWVDPT
jgi:hypothetical protein